MKFMVLRLDDLVWSSMFWQPEQNFFLPSVINYAFSFQTPNIFGCFYDVMTPFEIWKYKFLNETTLHVYLCGLKIIHDVKQWTACQRTSYHDTTNHCWHFSRVELLQSRDIHTANEHVPKCCKNFDSSWYITRIRFLYVMITKQQLCMSW